jgi:hypothetical protein
MLAFQPGTVGILPPGALGVGFFYHLTRQLTEYSQVAFIERRGSASAGALRAGGHLRIASASEIITVPTAQVLKPDLLTCYQTDTLPEVILVCPNPDQLLEVITTCVELLILAENTGQLSEDAPLPFPLVMFCANGIYFQRFRQILIEKLEEATLFGRLPDLWPTMMPRIVGRFLRGITIQTGVREGSGADTLYRPGPRSLTQVAGGDAASRQRACSILTELGGWFEPENQRTPTRLEFDKALINLTCNLLGQLWAIDEHGHFTLLTVNEILIPEHETEVQNLIQRVLQIGQAVKAYSPADTEASLYAQLKKVSSLHGSHVPSSLQWVGMRLRLGQLTAEVTPTESWLIDPLIRYAKSAGQEETALYFENLKTVLVRKLALAVAVSNS